MLLGERNLILTFYQLDNQIDFFIGNYYSGGEAFKVNEEALDGDGKALTL